MKRTFVVFLLFGLLSSVCLMFFGCGLDTHVGFYYTLNETGDGYIVEYKMGAKPRETSCPEEIVIPSEYKGIPVTEIATWGFDNCSDARRIVIPSTVTTIGNYAFERCSSLTELVIPAGVTEIGEGITSMCQSLTTLTVEEGNAAYIASGNCLIDTRSDTVIAGANDPTFPTDGSIRKIGPAAFTGLRMKELMIPEGVTSIEFEAFASTSSERVVLPDSLGYIGYHAFGHCASLRSIEISSRVTKIDAGAFSSCRSLKEVRLQTGIRVIGDFAFCDTALEDIHLPTGIAEMGKKVFAGCDSLSRITCADGSCPDGWDSLWCALREKVDGSHEVAWGVTEGNAE